MRSDEGQKYTQAARQWIRSRLRKESGATIGEDEMQQEFDTFFPVPGDGAQVIERKRVARAQAMRAMAQEAGQGFVEQDALDEILNTPTPGPIRGRTKTGVEFSVGS